MRPLGRLEKMVRAVTLIPGTTEFGYEPATVVRLLGPGAVRAGEPPRRARGVRCRRRARRTAGRVPEPRARRDRGRVVRQRSARGRIARCTPGVEFAIKQTHPARLVGRGRDARDARRSSRRSRAARHIGGTPSDDERDAPDPELNARGLKVTLYPFVMMDIPAGNDAARSLDRRRRRSRPIPGAGASPAIRRPASPARPTAPPRRRRRSMRSSARRRRLGLSPHGAALRAARRRCGRRRCVPDRLGAARADARALGLRRLSGGDAAGRRSPPMSKAILGDGTIVTYGADWTEYGAHVVDAGANEVRFPLDPLWASSAIDVVGIDYYAPLADWRDGAAHLDRQIADVDLRSRLSRRQSARRRGLRLVLRRRRGARRADAHADHRRARQALGVPRQGYLELVEQPALRARRRRRAWLARPPGCRRASRSGSPRSAARRSTRARTSRACFPIRSRRKAALPYFSTGQRDDLIQRRILEARACGVRSGARRDAREQSGFVRLWRPHDRPSAIHLWTWDARPYPVFPAALDVWSDGPNWETGHWLTGRLGGAPLDALVAAHPR